MNKQEQIEEMANIPHKCIKSSCEDCIKNDRKCTDYKQAEALYNAGYRKIDEFAECRNCTAWSGTDCTRHPYTQGCLKDENNIKRQAVKEFAEKLRKKVISLNVWEFGEIEIIDVDDIDELLKEYEE